MSAKPRRSCDSNRAPMPKDVCEHPPARLRIRRRRFRARRRDCCLLRVHAHGCPDRAQRGNQPVGGIVFARRRAASAVVVVAAARCGGGIDARLFHHTNAQCPTARRSRGRRLTTDRLLRPASSNARYRCPCTQGFPADTRVRSCMSVLRWLSSNRDRTVHRTWPFPSCRPVPLPEQWQCLPIDGRCAATCWNTPQRQAYT
jgi:hypothetical protein